LKRRREVINEPADIVNPNRDPDQNTTNVAGNLKKPVVHINDPPYNVTSCDQVLFIPGKRIFPENDYTKKVDAFFSMSAYMINMFESKDNNKFLESIAIRNMRTMPYILTGSKNCLIFQDTVTVRKITMCLEDNQILKEIQEAFLQLFNCRNGGRMQNRDDSVEKLYKALCNTPKTHPNYAEIKNGFAEELKKVGVRYDLIQVFSSIKNFGLF